MSAAASPKIAVIGSGISGAVCASILAKRGFPVTIFESGRGPGGRMSQRRETSEDGMELSFDHGAPFFTVEHEEVKVLVEKWMARGLVAEWNERFASFDRAASKFLEVEKEGTKRFVGVPGMNSICKALCHEPGVEAKFGTTVGKMDWLPNRSLWALSDLDGQELGYFNGVVASDKNVTSPRFTGVTGRSPPLDITLSPEIAVLLKDIPVNSCFTAMLAFSEPLPLVPVKGISFKNSEALSWSFCDSSKPGRTHDPAGNVECWVLHSTAEYAARVISRSGLRKPSSDILAKVAAELLQEFQTIAPNIPRPFFTKAHRWGSAFPLMAVGGEDKCVWDQSKSLAICGDFCASPSVEGAILSGMGAASKIMAFGVICESS